MAIKRGKPIFLSLALLLAIPNFSYGQRPADAPLDFGEIFISRYEETKASVVMIFAEVPPPKNQADAKKRYNAGAGVIVSSVPLPSGEFENKAVTNYHVIKKYISVSANLSLAEGYRASVLGYDEKKDLAAVVFKTPRHLRPATFGDSDKLRIGEWLYAIGHPFISFSWTLTVGVVSGPMRRLNKADRIQFGNEILPGNSGGGLFNLRGELVGIPANFAPMVNGGGITIPTNIGLAIPVNAVKKFLESLNTSPP